MYELDQKESVPHAKTGFDTVKIQLEKSLRVALQLFFDLQYAGKIYDPQGSINKIISTATTQLEILWINQTEIKEINDNMQKIFETILTNIPKGVK